MAEANLQVNIKVAIDWDPVLCALDLGYNGGVFWARIDTCGWPAEAQRQAWLAAWAIENRMFRQGCLADIPE